MVIARALLNDPDIILADEPTGNLDPDTSDDIIVLLKEISRTGRAVVVSTHNYTVLKRHEARTIKCEDGNLTRDKQKPGTRVYRLARFLLYSTSCFKGGSSLLL